MAARNSYAVVGGLVRAIVAYMPDRGARTARNVGPTRRLNPRPHSRL